MNEADRAAHFPPGRVAQFDIYIPGSEEAIELAYQQCYPAANVSSWKNWGILPVSLTSRSKTSRRTTNFLREIAEISTRGRTTKAGFTRLAI